MGRLFAKLAFPVLGSLLLSSALTGLLILQAQGADALWALGLGTSVALACAALTLRTALRAHVMRPISRLEASLDGICSGSTVGPADGEPEGDPGRLAARIDRLRSSQQELRARVEALEALDKQKDELLACTTHELKTPLNGILGLTENILLGAYGEMRKDQQEALELVLSCANRLREMTDSILQFSRLQSRGRQELSPPEACHLHDHMEEILPDLRATAEKAGLLLVNSVDSDFQVTCHRDELEQVVRILADNAVKYTQGGVVQILAERWAPPSPPGFQLAVRDTGIGIPVESQERIFEPFVRGTGPEKSVCGGVGLGLFMARKLVLEMGGQILLESEVGKGSTFTLLLPETESKEDLRKHFKPWPALTGSARVRLQEAEAPALVLRSKPQGKAEGASHVLVVDDEGLSREIIWQALREEFRVTCAPGGPTALGVLKSEPVDLVLLDILMPGMSGYDILDALQAAGLLQKIPVIALSAKVSREAIVKALELGASDYVGKPFHRPELLCRIRVHLSLKKQRDQLAARAEASDDKAPILEAVPALPEPEN